MAGLKTHALASLWLLRHITGTRMEVRGIEKLPKGACLVVSKHQSAWDTFALVPLFRDPAIVLKDELKWIPFYGWFCVKFEHILVKRDKAALALEEDDRGRAAAGRARGARSSFSGGHAPATRCAAGLQARLCGRSMRAWSFRVCRWRSTPGLYWPRRSIRRFPGTIVVEFLDPLPAGMPRKEFRRVIEARLEEASARLIAEAEARDGVRNTSEQ